MFKFTKYLALVLALVMTFLTLYTAYIGVRLLFCSEMVRDAEENWGRAMIDEAYIEANKHRVAIANESEYAKFVYYSNNAERMLILLAEAVAAYVSGMFYFVLVGIENKRKKRALKRKAG